MKSVASVAFFDHASRLLWGRRRDNGRWALPGGGINPGEDPATAANRELWEETGLRCNRPLEYLGAQTVQSGAVAVHCFKCHGEGQPTARNDPDAEFAAFEWHTLRQTPEYIMQALHSPYNVTLRLLGLQGDEEDGDDEEYVDIPEAEVRREAARQ